MPTHIRPTDTTITHYRIDRSYTHDASSTTPTHTTHTRTQRTKHAPTNPTNPTTHKTNATTTNNSPATPRLRRRATTRTRKARRLCSPRSAARRLAHGAAGECGDRDGGILLLAIEPEVEHLLEGWLRRSQVPGGRNDGNLPQLVKDAVQLGSVSPMCPRSEGRLRGLPNKIGEGCTGWPIEPCYWD